MPLARFHPIVAEWFSRTLGEPTAAQRRGWDAIRRGDDTLIAAPTGSGKTLAAFLTAIDDLVQDGIRTPLADEVRVLYVSPLKALSTDIHRNLAEPRRGIRDLAAASGLGIPRITAAVRTGDTPAGERAAMLRTPPHILVTTPESLYLLLTAERSRERLCTVRTVIVDEIHALAGTRRGAHLALSLERLEALRAEAMDGQRAAPGRLQRIGLSATQKPVETVARFLVGDPGARGGCTIVDEGHRRALDLEIEIPRSPLEAVLAHEVWEEYYDRLADLIGQHRTTLVFVNTRRQAERIARHLSERIGEDAVTAHHGSLARTTRLDAEHRLKTGTLRALVATASLELGIDIGHVDLVCQIGSPHRIATLLQRVGRAGHTVGGTPRGRLLPTSRDDLVECAALLRAVRQGDLDAIVAHEAPLDVLAQQITAETACRAWAEDDLFALVRRAWPYRDLTRAAFDAVVTMVADGFATRRGRRAALVHRDEVHATLRGRRGARLLAITCGGAIPELADYRVVMEPDGTFVGTVNEDFAIESMVGDVFQLGNTSWRVLQVTTGTVRVADAEGAPPNIPFWLGEAPARSDELSRAVADLRAEVARRLDSVASPVTAPGRPDPVEPGTEPAPAAGRHADALAWLQAEAGVTGGAAEQIVEYLAEGLQALGSMPTQDTLVLERFFDESGGMQLVLHAPFGSRVMRAWALALRKRFCRQFNFELQAAATEDGLLLSLGPQHSFPLADVFRYLHPASVRDVLVQAMLDAPVFETRWRWNATISLAVPRNRHGRRVPPHLQRMQADDLLAAVFPDAAACLENIPGDRELPDHPLVDQTVRDGLEEAMDLSRLVALLEQVHRGEVVCLSRDTPEPSVLAHEILNARPYAFLDDAPLEERRTHAVQTRRAGERRDEFGALDESAIGRVREEQRPDPRDADELHDALQVSGVLTADEVAPFDALLQPLIASGRATRVRFEAGDLRVAAERLPELQALHPAARLDPPTAAPATRLARSWTAAEALVSLVRARLTITGPTTAAALAATLHVAEGDIDTALLAIEADGAALRGRFTPGATGIEWCDRALLARIHRYTLTRLRAEIAPVTAADFMRFLFDWQHVSRTARVSGLDGLRAVLVQCDGLELPARAWERDVLPARMDRYEPALLDTLCLTGEIAWARLSSGPTQIVGATPIALFLREHAEIWRTAPVPPGAPPPGTPNPGTPEPRTPNPEPRTGNPELRTPDEEPGTPNVEQRTLNPEPGTQNSTKPTTTTPPPLDETTTKLLAQLQREGASFVHDLASTCALGMDELRTALAALVAAGQVSSDGFAGLRALVAPATAGGGTAGRHRVETAGRWFALPPRPEADGTGDRVETIARALLRRYGVVFRRLLVRDDPPVPWRDLVRVYRRLEARGEIRGGRFVAGMSGEQYALGDAVERLRQIRRTPSDEAEVIVSATDPLNLTGIVTPGERVRAASAARVVYRHGVPVAVIDPEGRRPLTDGAAAATAAAPAPAPVAATPRAS